jgi:hypothetical protein
LINKYVNIPSSQRFKNIVACFENLTSIPNICGTIDGIHILVTNFLSKKATLVVGHFFNKKKFHNIVLQAMCDVDKIFWNVCVGQLRTVHDSG